MTDSKQSKSDIVNELLCREDGADLAALCGATGWQPHSARAYLSGLRKKGFAINRSKNDDGTSVYRITSAPELAPPS